jgi:hypothetical protein
VVCTGKMMGIRRLGETSIRTLPSKEVKYMIVCFKFTFFVNWCFIQMSYWFKIDCESKPHSQIIYDPHVGKLTHAIIKQEEKSNIKLWGLISNRYAPTFGYFVNVSPPRFRNKTRA